MPKEPFDDLEVLNKLLRGYKDGNSMLRLSSIFKCSFKVVRDTLIFSGLAGKPVTPNQITKVQPAGRYYHLIFEPINDGSNYDTICKKQGVKVYKGSAMFTKKEMGKSKRVI